MCEKLPENQQMIADGLHEITTILETRGTPYIIEGGTLLGAIRENRFLPWDDDVGIAVATETVYEDRDTLVSELLSQGFTAGYRDDSYENFKINVIKNNVRYEILGWYLRGSWRRRLRYRMPARFLRDIKSLHFFGYVFNCPSDENKYLRHFYGNWNKVKKSGRFFSFYCFDQKRFWKKQLRKIMPCIPRD